MMWQQIIGLILIVLILAAPLVFDKKLKVEGGSLAQIMSKYTLDGNSRLVLRPYQKWRGPKTDARINQMLAESIVLLKGLGCPISDSICPEVVLTGTHCYYGRCCRKGSLKKYTEYDYYIEISGHTLQNTEKSLRNTLIHELIHTVPGGLSHRGAWKKWADYVSEKTGYIIKRCEGDETAQDQARLGRYETPSTGAERKNKKATKNYCKNLRIPITL